MIFRPLAGVEYKTDYLQLADDIEQWPEQGAEYEGVHFKRSDYELYRWRKVFQQDSWAILYFISQIPIANHKFVVDFAREFDSYPETDTLTLAARGHFKSSLITVAGSIKEINRDPNITIGIFSHTRELAFGFFRSIKQILEQSEFLKACFPDIYYQNPINEAFAWSDEKGLYVKRSSKAKEATIEAWGLVDSQPTGKHFDLRIYDDVETIEAQESSHHCEKLKRAYSMSQNLGSLFGRQRTLGTPYTHEGLLVELKDQKLPTGEPAYVVVEKPATHDGSWNGEPVLLTQRKLDSLKEDKKAYSSQQLLNPTPQEIMKLNHTYLKQVSVKDLPHKLFKFMTVDPAGSSGKRVDGRQADSWAIVVCGVDPHIDDIGASNLYVLDACIEPMSESDALQKIVEMYNRAGRVLKLGVEKVGISTAEIHIANALRSKGKHLSIEAGNLVVLRPGGRSKEQRIEASLAWPLNNGKIHLCESVPAAYRDRFGLEMEKFPNWKDDALDALSYQFDLLKEFKFGKHRQPTEKKKASWKDRLFQEDDRTNWMVQ